MATVINSTCSVCPVCLQQIKADYVVEEQLVFLHKVCPVHGVFKTKVWHNVLAFEQWRRPKIHRPLPYAVKPVKHGCPFDCGLCQNHRQRSCTVLLEITQRCNMHCAVCFAHGSPSHEPELTTIEQWYRTARASNPQVNIQLSGGEPTQRDDLPAIISLGKKLGVPFIQLNTNGLRLARESGYAQRLADAGLDSVFLQFDGTSDQIYIKLRHQPLLDLKKQALEHCAAAGLGVVLVPTLVPVINDDDIGNILQFALTNTPVVKGVHFQPISYFGRYPHPPQDTDRLTLAELMTAMENQSGGLFLAEHFNPPGCENALCSFHANYIVMTQDRVLSLNHPNCCAEPADAQDGSAKAVRHTARKWRGDNYAAVEEAPVRCFSSADPNAVDLDELLARGQSHSFMVSAMAFQDAWTLDLERLQECCVHIMSPEGLLIPFCAYNLTDTTGSALYRHA